jgi:hypothetical protein
MVHYLNLEDFLHLIHLQMIEEPDFLLEFSLVYVHDFRINISLEEKEAVQLYQF